MEDIPVFVRYVLVFGAGLIAAFINVMAGGGSALSVGLLTLLGIPANIANGTNRVGVMSAGISSVNAFHKKGKLDIKGSVPFAVIALIGSLAGAYFASVLSAAQFKKYLAAAMIFVITTLFIPKKGKISSSGAGRVKKILSYPAMLFVGFYGGFIQAGVGFLIMAVYRHLYNLDLVTVNGRKMLITLVFTIPAIVIFAVKGQIHWGYALSLAVGNYVGGVAAAHYSISKGDKIVKYILAFAILLMAFKFSGLI